MTDPAFTHVMPVQAAAGAGPRLGIGAVGTPVGLGSTDASVDARSVGVGVVVGVGAAVGVGDMPARTQPLSTTAAATARANAFSESSSPGRHVARSFIAVPLALTRSIPRGVKPPGSPGVRDRGCLASIGSI
jgi:hypothetical protein